MERHCSTGQTPLWTAVPMEEEEEEEEERFKSIYVRYIKIKACL